MSVSFNNWIRQFHRWMSITFTVTVIITFAVGAQGQTVTWVTYTPLVPLALLLLTGLYLFVLPYTARWRARRDQQVIRTAGSGSRGSDSSPKR